MNWEIEVYRIVARAKVSVHGCETAEQAKAAAFKAVQQNLVNWDKGEGYVAVPATFPFDQTVKAGPAKRLLKPPVGWSPPAVRRNGEADAR